MGRGPGNHATRSRALYRWCLSINYSPRVRVSCSYSFVFLSFCCCVLCEFLLKIHLNKLHRACLHKNGAGERLCFSYRVDHKKLFQFAQSGAHLSCINAPMAMCHKTHERRAREAMWIRECLGGNRRNLAHVSLQPKPVTYPFSHMTR